jgi:hypothetical protein
VDGDDAFVTSSAVMEGDLCLAIAERLASAADSAVAARESEILERFCVAALHDRRSATLHNAVRGIVYQGAVEIINLLVSSDGP